jgi:transposase
MCRENIHLIEMSRQFGFRRPAETAAVPRENAFLGWLRGERNHCKMVAIPTISDEDAKRPHRERESLIGEQSRIVNRMKATLIRLGIRGFNPKLKRAAERLEGLRTPEGEPIPPNTLAELRRDRLHRQSRACKPLPSAFPAGRFKAVHQARAATYVTLVQITFTGPIGL